MYVCMFLRSSDDEYIRIFATRIGFEMCIFYFFFDPKLFCFDFFRLLV